MSRVKTFDSTGIAPGGRLFAGDMNSIQDQYADLSNFSQTHDVSTLRVGDSSIQLLKFGTAEARISAALRTDGILRGLGGLYGGQFANAAAVGAGFRPFGIVVFDLSQNRYIMNVGTDASPTWLTISTSAETGTIAPIGSIMDYGGTADPNATWLICDGRSLLRAGTYATLFSILGTAYGSVDGTHFNIPDCRGRVTVGVDGAAGRLASNDAIGNTSGEEKHTMAVGELATHTHTLTNIAYATGPGGSTLDNLVPPHNDVVVGVNLSLGISSAGSSTPFNVMQPYVVTNKIIRAI